MKKAIRSSAILVATSAALLAAMVPAGATPAVKIKASQVITNAASVNSAEALTVGGSTFIQPYAQAAMTAYATPNSGVFTAQYLGVGSHTGRENVATGVYQLGFSDVPLGFANTAEGSGIVQVPDALAGVAIIYNLGFNNSWSAAPGDYSLASGDKYVYTPKTGTNALADIANAPNPNFTPVAPVATSIGAACKAALAAHPLQLSGAVLGQIWSGKSDVITNWDNAAIIALNPKLDVKVSVPSVKGYTTGAGTHLKTVTQKNATATVNCLNDVTAKTITRFSRKDGSGTTFMFTDYLTKVDSADFSAPTQSGFNDSLTNVGNTADTIYPGSGGSGDLATAVKSTDGAITYDEYGYGTAAKIAGANDSAANALVGLASIGSGAGTGYVAINSTSLTAAATAGVAAIEGNQLVCGGKFDISASNAPSTTCFSINNTDSAKAYPIAGFTYALLPTSSLTNLQGGSAASVLDRNQQLENLKFVLWFTNTYGTDANAAAQGFVALPKAVLTNNFTALCGTLNGSSTGFQNGAFSSLCKANN
jgi:ABC-type phosphate transport system substrate-binding protein